MVGVDSRAARVAWTVALLALGVLVVYSIRRTLMIFTAALLLAYLLSPLVSLVDRLSARRVSRNLSLAAVYLLLLGALITAGGLLGSAVVEQATALAANVPDLVQRLDKPWELPLPGWAQPIKANLIAALRAQLEQHSRDILPMLQRAGKGAISLIGNLTFLILVPILSFFFLKDGQRLRDGVLELFFQGPRRGLFEDILSDVHLLLAQFMRALVILSLATFVFYWLFFALAGVPYGLLLASIAGVLEFIPVLGPLTAAATALLVAGFLGYPHLLWMVAFFVAYRLFQDYVLQPYLMSSGVALHPLVVIFGVLAGEQVGGVAGMFLSIPVLAILRVVLVRFRKARQILET